MSWQTLEGKKGGQASRPVSNAKLKALLPLHVHPIELVVFKWSSGIKDPGTSHLQGGLALRCFQRLSFPDIATQRCHCSDNWNTRGQSIPGPLVLRNDLVKCPAPAVDKDQTVLRRFEPSSRTSLTGEQPDPWDLLQPQDEMSRHRGAKQRRRYGRLGAISLLSPEYLLSVEQRRFHVPSLDH